MAFGISTYAYLWQISGRAPRPLTLPDMLRDTARLGGEVLQICDYPPVEDLDARGLAEIRGLADELGLTLELGTRGVTAERLRTHLEIARELGITLVRSMVNTPDHRPTPDEAVALLRGSLPAYEAAGVTLGLETYEQISTADLLGIVRGADSPNLGVVLDPGNSVARMEHPVDVVEATAPYVVNIHVKDFAFSRRDGWVGFELAGRPLGEGLLDHGHLVDRVRPHERGINQIVEHWLPWQGDYETTARLERHWTRHDIETLTRSN